MSTFIVRSESTSVRDVYTALLIFHEFRDTGAHKAVLFSREAMNLEIRMFSQLSYNAVVASLLRPSIVENRILKTMGVMEEIASDMYTLIAEMA